MLCKRQISCHSNVSSTAVIKMKKYFQTWTKVLHDIWAFDVYKKIFQVPANTMKQALTEAGTGIKRIQFDLEDDKNISHQ